MSSLSNTIRYHRSKLRPALPRNLSSIVIPDEYKQTETGDRFLLADDVTIDDRIVIFLSDPSLTLMSSANTISCDGTFRTVPSLFEQLFSVSYFHNDKLLPG